MLDSGSTTDFWGDPFFMFHTVNAFEDEKGIINLDLLVYEDADVITKAFKTESLIKNGLAKLTPKLKRIRLLNDNKNFEMNDIVKGGQFEFPAINYSQKNGHPYGFVWGSDLVNIKKVDLIKNEINSTDFRDQAVGEPVYVSNPDAQTEDDGVILTVTSHTKSHTSSLLILDARSLAIIASAEVPFTLPLGYHGSFEKL